MLVVGRQENDELTERSDDPSNPLRWEKVGRDGSRLKISTLANVEEGQLRKYNVLLYENNTYMTFKLSFLQGITETDDGFLYCVQYGKNDIVLAERKVEVNVIVLAERKVEVNVIAKTTTAAPTTTSTQTTTNISNNICIDGHEMCTHLLPGECEAALHLMIFCPASCGNCNRPDRYCADRSNYCSKVKDQCNDRAIKHICQSTCNVCDANACNSTLISSALSQNLVLSHSVADYCADGTRTNADSVILQLCNARTDKMWQKGKQVVSNCKQISLYAPVSSFGSFSHQVGIFLGCTDTGIKIGIQKCNDHFKEQTLVSGDTSTAFSNADVYHVLIVK
ncbi:unnamed protein product [Mytilus coruscus]|uniref:ShKT domain-containing protein n=1 Tax=Mytilus coruscus TaxID=42192 RepID=A0A6J8CWF9_MYTCO|nr:unnamed protein product [Mytilus coruscus]